MFTKWEKFLLVVVTITAISSASLVIENYTNLEPTKTMNILLYEYPLETYPVVFERN